jgi:hypothetical protein
MRGFAAVVFILSLPLILMGSPAISPCAETEPVQVVESEGNSVIAGYDHARARNEAVRDALQKAVAQVADRWLAPRDVERKSEELLKAQIYGKSEGFIQDYRVVSEVALPDLYTVAIRASVLAEAVRGDLQRLGLIGSAERKGPANSITLTIRGIRDYNGYTRCLGILKEGIPGIREVILREASWGLARFDIAAEAAVPVLSERLRERMAVDIQHQDEHVLEVSLQ